MRALIERIFEKSPDFYEKSYADGTASGARRSSRDTEIRDWKCVGLPAHAGVGEEKKGSSPPRLRRPVRAHLPGKILQQSRGATILSLLEIGSRDIPPVAAGFPGVPFPRAGSGGDKQTPTCVRRSANYLTATDSESGFRETVAADRHWRQGPNAFHAASGRRFLMSPGLPSEAVFYNGWVLRGRRSAISGRPLTCATRSALGADALDISVAEVPFARWNSLGAILGEGQFRSQRFGNRATERSQWSKRTSVVSYRQERGERGRRPD